MFGENVEFYYAPICSVIASYTGLGAVGVQYIKKIKGIE